jgi:Prokaryotic RING finger family 1
MAIAVICPYCRSAVFPDTDISKCPACGTTHHAACWQEYGHCSVFGCPGKVIVPAAKLLFLIPGIVWSLFLLIPPATAIIFGPLVIPAVIFCIIEVCYFAYALTKRLPFQVRCRYIVYLLVSLFPICLAVFKR